MGTPAIPDLGKQCSVDDCKLIDFLPFTCDSCHKVFCLEHRGYSTHQCPNANRNDVTVVVCPLCAKGVHLVPDQDPNITWESHVNTDCDPSNYDKVTKKKKCPVKGCKETLTFSNTIKCRDCTVDHCLKHRFGPDHSCPGPKKPEPALPFWRVPTTKKQNPPPKRASHAPAPAPAASSVKASAEAGIAKLSGPSSGQGASTSTSGQVEKVHEKKGVMNVTLDVCPKCSKGFRDPVALVEHSSSLSPYRRDSKAGGAFQELPLIRFLSLSSLLELREFRGLEGKEAESVVLEETGKAFVTLLVLCCFCPGLRTRSRQPVKRYKKLIADIFPRSPDEEPNDRKIAKLCEYAVRNPLRLPRLLYPQVFGYLQKDGTYMFSLEKFIPKLCQLAQEVGEDTRVEPLRSAALQTLSAMVWFMGRYSYMSPEFDHIVSVVLENYGGLGKDSQNPNQNRVQEVLRDERNISPNALVKVPSWKSIVDEKGELTVTAEEAKSPSFWSRVCLHNMAKLAKEATTMRRILESLFRCFDNENLWLASRGVAFPVLKDMQTIIDDSGEITHFLLSVLVKHLDHKNVLKRPHMQLDILDVTTSLTRETKIKPSFAIVGAINDILRHLRKAIHNSVTDANLGADTITWHRKFQEAVDECLVELSSKVGDASPIFDIMAAMLENISNIKVIAQTTVAAVYRTAQAFPESLFHQLLPAMIHQDNETRIGAHRIFSVVLVPSSVCPQPTPNKNIDPKNVLRSLSRNVSVFSSSAALFQKMKRDKTTVGKEKIHNEVEQPKINNVGMMNRIKSTYSRTYSIKIPVSQVGTTDNDTVTLRLSSHQISLLLSSIWAQSISPDNTPENYVAISHTYSLVLIYSRGKNSSREALIRSFQLAFSLLNISLAEGGSLPPSRRRSLYTLATSMIIISGKAFGVVPLVPLAKSALASKMVDPFLCLVDDCKLTVGAGSDHIKDGYGSKEDNRAALKSLSEINLTKDQSAESLATAIVKHLETAVGSEITSIEEELLHRFVPDDVCPISYGSIDILLNKGHPKDEVARLFSLDDSPTKQNSDMELEMSDLISVDQLLESVMESAQQFGRMSVCCAPKMSFMEMTNHFEELGIGKETKMSDVMGMQDKPEHQNTGIHSAGNSFMEQSAAPAVSKPGSDVPSSFRLPVANPYDNFLRAARS
ncbi:armadillo-type fold protein [Artemisia annua]|uniref:Armadillo-type fold protein n=1 Tax=Artemisia annua TaxID=35608 RepID=A0A2U1M0V6_ARTAN|nr:armadillo-type fold protein [Artemisia annua]